MRETFDGLLLGVLLRQRGQHVCATAGHGRQRLRVVRLQQRVEPRAQLADTIFVNAPCVLAVQHLRA